MNPSSTRKQWLDAIELAQDVIGALSAQWNEPRVVGFELAGRTDAIWAATSVESTLAIKIAMGRNALAHVCELERVVPGVEWSVMSRMDAVFVSIDPRSDLVPPTIALMKELGLKPRDWMPQIQHLEPGRQPHIPDPQTLMTVTTVLAQLATLADDIPPHPLDDGSVLVCIQSADGVWRSEIRPTPSTAFVIDPPKDVAGPMWRAAAEVTGVSADRWQVVRDVIASAPNDPHAAGEFLIVHDGATALLEPELKAVRTPEAIRTELSQAIAMAGARPSVIETDEAELYEELVPLCSFLRIPIALLHWASAARRHLFTVEPDVPGAALDLEENAALADALPRRLAVPLRSGPRQYMVDLHSDLQTEAMQIATEIAPMLQGDEEDPAAALEQFAMEHPDRVEFIKAAASAHEVRGRHDVAIALRERATELFPHDPELNLRRLALEREKHGDDWMLRNRRDSIELEHVFGSDLDGVRILDLAFFLEITVPLLRASRRYEEAAEREELQKILYGYVSRSIAVGFRDATESNFIDEPDDDDDLAERVRYRLALQLDTKTLPVRRIVEIDSTAMLDELSVTIQCAMCWSGELPHRFEADRPLDDALLMKDDAWARPIGDVLYEPGDEIEYIYGARDEWTVRVALKRVLAEGTGRRPACKGGTGAEPLEIFGNPSLFEFVVALLSGRPESDEARRWRAKLPPTWQPNEFDRKAITRRLKRRI